MRMSLRTLLALVWADLCMGADMQLDNDQGRPIHIGLGQGLGLQLIILARGHGSKALLPMEQANSKIGKHSAFW